MNPIQSLTRFDNIIMLALLFISCAYYSQNAKQSLKGKKISPYPQIISRDDILSNFVGIDSLLCKLLSFDRDTMPPNSKGDRPLYSTYPYSICLPVETFNRLSPDARENLIACLRSKNTVIETNSKYVCTNSPNSSKSGSRIERPVTLKITQRILNEKSSPCEMIYLTIEIGAELGMGGGKHIVYNLNCREGEYRLGDLMENLTYE